VSHWHFTTAELALLGPAGLIVGTGLTVWATRKTAADSLKAQEQATQAQREEAEADRHADREREQRDHRRAAYAELGGGLQAIDELLNLLVGPVLLTSGLPETDWTASGSVELWAEHYAQVLRSLPECRRAAMVYGTPEIRGVVRAIGTLSRALGPPEQFSDSAGHWIHVLSREGDGIRPGLETVSGGGTQLQGTVLANIQIVQSFIQYALAQIRHEQQPQDAPRPERPAGLVVNPLV
jgi:hypothetical protein